jgi:hypothetical protein
LPTNLRRCTSPNNFKMKCSQSWRHKGLQVAMSLLWKKARSLLSSSSLKS